MLGKREYYAQPRVAATYYEFSFGGRSGEWVEQREAQTLLELIGRAQSVLDLACGEGRIARRLASRARVVGCDTSFPMLRAARSRDVPALVCADAFQLPFAAGSFDCVVCARLLFHYPDFGGILRELYRVTHATGRVVFDTFRWSPRAGLPILTTRWDGPIYTTSVKDVRCRLDREDWVVLERKGCFLFSPLAYRYLPFRLVRMLEAIEKTCPDRLLVKDYWNVGKRPSAQP